jgi:hypothetical protein
MKFDQLPKAEIRATDTAAMREAIAFLTAQGVDVRRPSKSAYQLKLDATTSFYPGKGTLFIDGDQCAWPETGEAALKKWLVARQLQGIILDTSE